MSDETRRTDGRGGAVAGVGIEATSFRHGLVHDTLLEADVLLADGRVVTCTPQNEHRDLFLGLPNSYGTLGYLVRLRLATRPVRPFVRVEHRRFGSPAAFLEALDAACDDPASAWDFVDGAVFAADDLVLNLARFVDHAPATSDYTYLSIYHRSLRERTVDHLTVRDWLWRWDTDWFWCSRNFGAEHPLVRRLLGRKRLNSRTWTRLMRLNARYGLTRRIARWRGVHPETVIQDVDLPSAGAGAFLDVLLPERQDLQQRQGLLRFLEGRNVLQHGLGFPVLRDDQGLPVFGQVGQHLGGIGLEVTDGLDLG